MPISGGRSTKRNTYSSIKDDNRFSSDDTFSSCLPTFKPLRHTHKQTDRQGKIFFCSLNSFSHNKASIFAVSYSLTKKPHCQNDSKMQNFTFQFSHTSDSHSLAHSALHCIIYICIYTPFIWSVQYTMQKTERKKRKEMRYLWPFYTHILHTNCAVAKIRDVSLKVFCVSV